MTSKSPSPQPFLPSINENIKIDFVEDGAQGGVESVESFKLWRRSITSVMLVMSVVHITLGFVCFIGVIIEVVSGFIHPQVPGIWAGVSYVLGGILVGITIIRQELLMNVALAMFNLITTCISIAACVICFSPVTGVDDLGKDESDMFAMAVAMSGTSASIEIVLNAISMFISVRGLFNWCQYNSDLHQQEQVEIGCAEDGTMLKHFVVLDEKGKPVDVRRPTVWVDPGDPTSLDYDIFVRGPSTSGLAGHRQSSIKPYTKDKTKLPIPVPPKKKRKKRKRELLQVGLKKTESGF